MNTAICWFFLLYFVILYAERLQSLIRTARDPKFSFLQDGFHAYVNIITGLSLAAGLVLIAFFNPTFLKALVSASVGPDYSMLVITSGVVLVSGMVHTEYTIAPVQFVAYGMLIVSIVLQTILNAPAADSLFRLWYSMGYLVVFSMAIPVMYESKIPQKTIFHILEAITALLLVAAFTVMLRMVFVGPAEDLLLWCPLIAAVILDAVLIWMRRKEELNSFVLIFAALSLVMFIAGRILFAFI